MQACESNLVCFHTVVVLWRTPFFSPTVHRSSFYGRNEVVRLVQRHARAFPMNFNSGPGVYPVKKQPVTVSAVRSLNITAPPLSPISSSDDEAEDSQTPLATSSTFPYPAGYSSSAMETSESPTMQQSSSSSLQAPSPAGSATGSNNALLYPPNHPLSSSKHLCSICGDRASGKHYGVYR